jgi:RNase H-fold protein (predicted Holliday junction resolvase)
VINRRRVNRTIAWGLATALNALVVAAAVCFVVTTWTAVADTGEPAGVTVEGGWTLVNAAIALVTVAAGLYTARAQRRQDRDSELYERVERQVKLFEERVTSEVARSKLLEQEVAACHAARETQDKTIADQHLRIESLDQTVREQGVKIDDLIDRLARTMLEHRPRP